MPSRRLIYLAALLAALLTAPRAVLAQATRAIDDGTSQVPLPSVLSTYTGTSLDFRLDHTRDDSDATILALQLHAQHLTRGGAGGYLTLPIGRISVADESETEIGNLEIGGLYASRGRGVEGYARVGLAIDTTDDDASLLLPLVNLVPRLVDAAPTGLDANWLRLGGGLRARSGLLVIGGSAGLDVVLADREANFLLGLAASAGIASRAYGLTGGFALSKVMDSNASDTITTSFQLVANAAIASATHLFGTYAVYLEEASDVYSIGVGVRLGL